MNGIIFWACSNCRSTMAFYRALAEDLGVPFVVAVWFLPKDGGCAVRSELGFRADEFTDIEIVPIGHDYKKGLRLLDSHPDWHNFFGVYQGAASYRKLIAECRRRGQKAAVICEAPCNMSSGVRRVLKGIYLMHVLPRTVRKSVSAADFFVNLSGDSTRWVRHNGWAEDKIIPFGYYPPAIEGTLPTLHRWSRPLRILATGKLSRYRGADILVRALLLLKKWGIEYKAVITQKGELSGFLAEFVRKHKLPVELPGFVEMGRLKKLYAESSVFVGAGRDEPWGMRLNDALQCGLPMIVSRGMGGVQLVSRYDCGMDFDREDYVDLANKLRIFALDAARYDKYAKAAYDAASTISPDKMAKELIREINLRFPEWINEKSR